MCMNGVESIIDYFKEEYARNYLAEYLNIEGDEADNILTDEFIASLPDDEEELIKSLTNAVKK